jgi:hypothetical protein
MTSTHCIIAFSTLPIHLSKQPATMGCLYSIRDCIHESNKWADRGRAQVVLKTCHLHIYLQRVRASCFQGPTPRKIKRAFAIALLIRRENSFQIFSYSNRFLNIAHTTKVIFFQQAKKKSQFSKIHNLFFIKLETFLQIKYFEKTYT